MIRNVFTFLMLLPSVVFPQNLIKSGPMKGYNEMREVAIWVQLTEPGIAELIYWPDTAPELEFRSLSKSAIPENGNTAELIATQVEPGTTYGYSIYVNGKNQTIDRELSFTTQPLWQYRTDPPELKIAFGSCSYINEEPYDRPGRSYGSNYKIFEEIASDNPDMMLWLGDNIYLREVDYFSRSGIIKRYTHTRSVPEMQNLLATAHHYAIWDDHDFGPNDATRMFPMKDETLEAFKLFWSNKKYGVNNLGGITNSFAYGDIHFYLLDNRWNRSEADMVTIKEQMLGADQIDWLIESLKYSRAPFKFVAVGSQILNTAAVYENYANYEEERASLLNRIAEEGITGVIFLTGDRHHSEMSMVEINGIEIYDITVSPLTSGTHKPGDEKNDNRIEGSLINEHNYGLITITGKRKERKLNLQIKSNTGKELWHYEISAAD
ncbi:MAG: alkaline phosphatase D family protein [Bacteroidota bacterium]